MSALLDGLSTEGSSGFGKVATGETTIDDVIPLVERASRAAGITVSRAGANPPAKAAAQCFVTRRRTRSRICTRARSARIDTQHLTRSFVRLYRSEKANLALASAAFFIKHAPVWIAPFMSAVVIDTVVRHASASRLVVAGAVMAVSLLFNYPATLYYVRRQSLAIRNIEANFAVL